MTSLTHTSDESLIDLIRGGDSEAFTELYHRYKRLLVVHAYKKLGSVDDAKEVVQESFSTLWARRNKLPQTNNVSSYLYTLVRNRILNQMEHLQVEARYAASFHTFVSEQNYVTDLHLREKEMAAMIAREIDALPPKMREVFLLSRQQHLTQQQIADRLQISVFTVKNHMKAALKILRLRLGLVIVAALHHYL